MGNAQGLNNLETLRRAPGFFKYAEHSVAVHSFKVAAIAQMLGDIEEHAGNIVNWQRLLENEQNQLRIKNDGGLLRCFFVASICGSANPWSMSSACNLEPTSQNQLGSSTEKL